MTERMAPRLTASQFLQGVRDLAHEASHQDLPEDNEFDAAIVNGALVVIARYTHIDGRAYRQHFELQLSEITAPTYDELH